MCTHVLNDVSQVLHVFPIMFPIAQDFYPIGFAQSFPLSPYIAGGQMGTLNLDIETYILKSFQIFCLVFLFFGDGKSKWFTLK